MNFSKRFFGTWAVAILGAALLFWPLAAWPNSPERELFWFGFLAMNLFAALIASGKI